MSDSSFLLLFSHPATETGLEFALFFIPVSLIGLLLGLWKRWASAIWLTLILIYLAFRVGEISWLYNEFYFSLHWLLTSDFGQIHLAALFGIVLNIIGLFIRRKKITLP